ATGRRPACRSKTNFGKVCARSPTRKRQSCRPSCDKSTKGGKAITCPRRSASSCSISCADKLRRQNSAPRNRPRNKPKWSEHRGQTRATRVLAMRLSVASLAAVRQRERRLAVTMIAAPPARVAAPLRPWYIAAAAAALAAMIAAILSPSLWVLDFVHVMTGALWTGIDPRTLILMPTLSIITSTSGWFLAVRLGYLDLGYPQFWWVIAALGIVSVLTVQGLGILLPMNLRLYFEIMKPAPDHDKLKRWMRTYVRVVAAQGTMQVAIIVVMARFATGL